MVFVFGRYSQAELDRQYDQSKWSRKPPQHTEQRYRTLSDDARKLLGLPREFAYGTSADERLDVYRAAGDRNPVLMYFHGGAWRILDKDVSAFPAPLFVSHGVCYIAVNFGLLPNVTMPEMVDQVRRSVIWVSNNANQFGGDPDRIHISGHSSGAHLAACAAVTDWKQAYGVQPDIIKSALCASGAYDLEAVQKSARNHYMRLTDEMVHHFSPTRQLRTLSCSIDLAVGALESDEFRRQSNDFARDAGLALHVEPESDHFETSFTLGDAEGCLAKLALARIFS